MDNTREFNPLMDFGNGLDDLNGNVRGKGVTYSAPSADGEFGGQTVSFQLKIAETTDDLKKSMGIDVSVSGSYDLFSGSEKFSFAEQSNFHSYSIFLVAGITVANPPTVIENETLTASANQLLAAGNSDRFRQEFGDLYVKEITSGGELWAILEFVTRSDSDKVDISNRLSAGLSFGIGGVDASVGFTDAIQKTTQNMQISVNVFQRGGAGESAKMSISLTELVEKITSFPVAVKASPVRYTASLQDYLALDLPLPPNFIQIQAAKDILAKFIQDRSLLLQFLSDVDYVEAHADQFEPYDASALTAYVTKVTDSLNAITSAASTCANDITKCQFVPALVVDRSILPKRLTLSMPDFAAAWELDGKKGSFDDPSTNVGRLVAYLQQHSVTVTFGGFGATGTAAGWPGHHIAAGFHQNPAARTLLTTGMTVSIASGNEWVPD